MENNERDRKLEQWLDEALSQYSAAEPRLGLEKRVLARVRAEEQTRAGRNWWRWMPAFAAIAAVLIVAVAVRPYWEQKTASSGDVASGNRPTPTSAKNEAILKENRSQAKPDAVVADKAAPKEQESLGRIQPTRNAPAIGVLKAQQERVASGELQSAKKKDLAAAQTRAVPTISSPDSKQMIAGANDPVINVRRTENLYQTPAAPAPAAAAPMSQANLAAAGGRADGAKSVTDASRASGEVQSASTVPGAQSGIVATEQIVTMPDVSAKMRAMKVHAKAKGPLAKKLEEDVDTVDVPGVGTLRTSLKPVRPGPMQQFPSPAPLSKEEERMLAVAKHLRNAPARDEKQKDDGDNNAVEIKKIEIAPLAGPPK